MSRLCLGTAQWGTDYGATNAVGRMSDSVCMDLIETARACGVHAIDTALHYGDAQLRLRAWTKDFEFTTKVSCFDTTREVLQCLDQLGVQQVQTILLHDWDDVPRDVRRRAVLDLANFVDDGLVQAVGVSVYGETAVRSALNDFAHAGVPLGAIQVPANAIDHRLNHSSSIPELIANKVRVQVRSVFLQGFLASQTASGLGSHRDVQAFHAYAAELGATPIEVALAHLKSLEWVDEIVVGVTSSDELQFIAEVWARIEPNQAPIDLASEDLDLIDPRRW